MQVLQMYNEITVNAYCVIMRGSGYHLKTPLHSAVFLAGQICLFIMRSVYVTYMHVLDRSGQTTN